LDTATTWQPGIEQGTTVFGMAELPGSGTWSNHAVLASPPSLRAGLARSRGWLSPSWSSATGEENVDGMAWRMGRGPCFALPNRAGIPPFFSRSEPGHDKSPPAQFVARRGHHSWASSHPSEALGQLFIIGRGKSRCQSLISEISEISDTPGSRECGWMHPRVPDLAGDSGRPILGDCCQQHDVMLSLNFHSLAISIGTPPAPSARAATNPGRP